MSIQIGSDSLLVSVNLFGTEVSSVKNRKGLEYIWQADKEVWPRHAPVLFPIVGKLKDNQFIFENKTYALSQHGFARDREFELIHRTEDSCIFQLSSDEQSKAAYPFDFIFRIHYRLEKNMLVTGYTVINTGDSEMYFSVGAHPGFNCPLLPDEKFEDYYLEFEAGDYERTELNNGLRTNIKKTIFLEDNKLFLTKHLFDSDALVFENKQVQQISLRSARSSHAISLQCPDWPYFGIWSKKGCTDFICLEPWFGVADKENSDHQLIYKEGILSLASKKEFNCSFSTRFD